MRLELLRPRPAISARFEFRYVNSLPDLAGCYALSTASDEILYVGQARSLRKRLLQHWEDGRHNIATLHGRISTVSVVVLTDDKALNAYERGWINQCELADGQRPVLNKISAPV